VLVLSVVCPTLCCEPLMESLTPLRRPGTLLRRLSSISASSVRECRRDVLQSKSMSSLYAEDDSSALGTKREERRRRRASLSAIQEWSVGAPRLSASELRRKERKPPSSSSLLTKQATVLDMHEQELLTKALDNGKRAAGKAYRVLGSDPSSAKLARHFGVEENVVKKVMAVYLVDREWTGAKR